MQIDAVRILLVLRLLAFMALIYLCVSMIIHRVVSRPESKVRGFFQLLCRPLVAPVAAVLPSGTSYGSLLVITTILVAAVWLGLAVASTLVAAR